MNRNQFISFLNHPEVLSTESIPLLEGVIKNFPYFQTAQLLYARNLHDQNSMHYSGQLKLAAAYASDRKVLYELINREEGPATPEYPIEHQAEINKNVFPSDPVDVKETQTVFLEEPPTRISDEPSDEDKKIINPDVEENASLPFTELNVRNISSLEKEIIVKAIDSSIEQEVSKPLTVDFEKKQNQEKTDLNVEKNSRERAYSFSDWLKLTKEGADKEEKRESSYALLIDKFISQEPKISRASAAFFSPVDKARKSVLENDSLVTATLAEIYVKQANYAKAIKAYEALSLKYPEKSRYFAARIQEIKSLINNSSK